MTPADEYRIRNLGPSSWDEAQFVQAQFARAAQASFNHLGNWLSAVLILRAIEMQRVLNIAPQIRVPLTDPTSPKAKP